MALDDELVVLERALAQVSIMLVVVIVCLSKKILRSQHTILLALDIYLPSSEDGGIPPHEPDIRRRIFR